MSFIIFSQMIKGRTCFMNRTHSQNRACGCSRVFTILFLERSQGKSKGVQVAPFSRNSLGKEMFHLLDPNAPRVKSHTPPHSLSKGVLRTTFSFNDQILLFRHSKTCHYNVPCSDQVPGGLLRCTTPWLQPW